MLQRHTFPEHTHTDTHTETHTHTQTHTQRHTHTHTHETHMQEGTYVHLAMDSCASEDENWLKHLTADSVEEKECEQW